MLKFSPLKTLSALALLLCVVVACQESGSSDTKTLKSSDGKYQLTVPSNWTSRTKSNEMAGDTPIMGAINSNESILLFVFSQSKADLADDMTIDKYTEMGRDDRLKTNGSDATTPVPVNNGAARQYELTMTTEGSKARCVYTSAEGPDRFFRINACTLPSKFDDNKAVIKQVSESFRPVSDSNQTSSP